MKIKVPIVINESNEWYTCASSNWNDDTNIEESRGNLSGDFIRVFWAEIEIPDPPKNLLEGKVV